MQINAEFGSRDGRSENFLQLDVSRWPLLLLVVWFPREESHDDDHERQSHTQKDPADGQLHGTPLCDRGPHTLLHRGRLEHKGWSEVQKRGPGAPCGHLTPPPPVVVLRLQLCEQSDVTARVFNQLVPAGASSKTLWLDFLYSWKMMWNLLSSSLCGLSSLQKLSLPWRHFLGDDDKHEKPAV